MSYISYATTLSSEKIYITDTIDYLPLDTSTGATVFVTDADKGSFYIKEIFLIVTELSGPSGVPSIRIGTSGNRTIVAADKSFDVNLAVNATYEVPLQINTGTGSGIYLVPPSTTIEVFSTSTASPSLLKFKLITRGFYLGA